MLAQENIKQAIRVIQVHADASFGLRRWAKAFDYYQRVLQLQPDNIAALINSGNCLALSGRLLEALGYYDKVVDMVSHLAEKEERVEVARSLAECLNNRGIVLMISGEYVKSIENFDKAIDVSTKLAKEHDTQTELAQDLARGLSNRGIALHYWRPSAKGMADLDQAISIWTRLIQ
jgi:tetratricopeptide (TPR) repeat protein